MKITTVVLCLCLQLSVFAQNRLRNAILPECVTDENPYKCTNDKLEFDIQNLIDEVVISTLLESSKAYFSVSVAFITDDNGVVIKELTQIKSPSYLLTKRIQNYIAGLMPLTPKDSSIEEKRSSHFINFTLLKDDASQKYYIADYLDLKEKKINPEYITPDIVSLYPGCDKLDKPTDPSCTLKKVYEFIMKNYRIPEVDSPTQVKMVVNFFIDTTGKIQVESIEGGENGFQKGVREAIVKLPRLTPTIYKGVPIIALHKLPISLNLK